MFGAAEPFECADGEVDHCLVISATAAAETNAVMRRFGDLNDDNGVTAAAKNVFSFGAGVGDLRARAPRTSARRCSRTRTDDATRTRETCPLVKKYLTLYTSRRLFLYLC
ncbi:hypothetical protein EVAR_88152_1 [Eumeta japonica]|uniref:Uncharacterized protein n=1 Tax=Eumeta variegata TaxID=151549 RepID=A0A4C1WPF5_EUMVA|nr:hypothetical protein EVAR_88152_1 [Eumeta japonica]